MPIQTWVSHDPHRDMFEPATVTSVSTPSAATAAVVLDLIDGALRAQDALFTPRTRLAEEPDPLQRVPTPQPSVRRPDGTSPISTDYLERCLQDIQDWLAVGLNDATRAAGIDRGTVYAWRRRGSDPRPGTVGAVLRLHSLVASVVHAAGAARAREWFHSGDPSPLSRLLEGRGDPATMSAVSGDARRRISGPALPPPNALLGATVDDEPARPLV